MENFESVIGLEVHAQLSTDSKIFARSSTAAGKRPNTLTDPVTLGLPGVLPVLNRRVVDFAMRLGLAMGCEIQRESVFSRKHYFYPDLPKGYQISQYDKPICLKGHLTLRAKGEPRTIRLTRIHLEEDAGKNTHAENEPFSEVDLNRAGVPLVEIVTEPDIRTPEEAGIFLKQLRQLLRYLDVCDGNMEEGSMRCDANVSVRKVGETVLGTKVEIKNLNSFRYVEKAIAFEIERQVSNVQRGEPILQETRLWDDIKGVTRAMRSKEQAEDYRYFPDPDLLPLVVDSEWLAKVKSSLPELPQQTFQRFRSMYQLDEYLCELLTEEKLVASYYDRAVMIHDNPTGIANWITTELFGRLNKESLTMEDCPVSPENLATLVRLIDSGTISGKIAKSVFEEMFNTSAAPDDVVREKGLVQITDSGVLEKVIDDLLLKNPTQVQDYREGKTKVFGFFVGQVMKATEGKGNPKLVNELLEKKLKG